MVIDNLINYWKEQDIYMPNDEVTEDILIAFELMNDIKLSNEFKEYLLRVNGMICSNIIDKDQEGFLFYSLNELQFEKFSNGELHLIFADYMDRSCWYSLEVSGINNVCVIRDENKSTFITKSFFEFLEMYLSDSVELYK